MEFALVCCPHSQRGGEEEGRDYQFRRDGMGGYHWNHDGGAGELGVLGRGCCVGHARFIPRARRLAENYQHLCMEDDDAVLG